MIDIREAFTDSNLLGAHFGGESWAAWRALLAGFYGLPLDAPEAAIFKELTGRRTIGSEPSCELWLAVGRRGGKSNVAGGLAIFEACFRDYRDRLAPGEIATIMIIAADRRQARTVMRYISGLVSANPMLKRMVIRETTESIEFDNRTCIEVHTASFRAVRGYTLACVIADEIAFWHVDGASPDKEIITALRPALSTLNGKLLGLSSPYAKRGQLWQVFKAHYGDASSPVLVARAPTLRMNPTLDKSIVKRAMKEDPEAARSEYMAEFRSDIASFLDADLIQECTRPKPRELPPALGVQYLAFTDPAGGGGDEFTLSIAHRESDMVCVDLIHGRRGSPADCVAEFVPILARYGITAVSGDRYAGRWPRDEFEKYGIRYMVSDLDRSGLYMEFLAALNSGRVELPPCERTARQFISLERRTSRAGKDAVDHPPGSHDDRANAVAGVVAHMAKKTPVARVFLSNKVRRKYKGAA